MILGKIHGLSEPVLLNEQDWHHFHFTDMKKNDGKIEIYYF